MKSERMARVALPLLIITLFSVQCAIDPASPGKRKDNTPPETFLSPVPPEGSMNNSFKMRLQWRGNDQDGVISSYEYRVKGPLYDNTWQATEYFFQDLKFRNGWYEFQVRSIDDDGAADETPASVRFHVRGPTFDKGVLFVDDDRIDPGNDPNVDAFFDSLFVAAGYTKYDGSGNYPPRTYTVWDVTEKFGFTVPPKFVPDAPDTVAYDANGEIYETLGAYSTVIWHVGVGGENNISKLEKALSNFLDMGGNLMITGITPMLSILGEVPLGESLPDNSFARNYLHIRAAEVAGMEIDRLLSANANYPDINTRFVIELSGWTMYLGAAANQLIPTPDAEVLYTFSRNSYVNQFGVNVNAEKFAGMPCAVKYIGDVYRVVVLGFPMVHTLQVPVGGQLVNWDLIELNAMKETFRHILEDEFEEPK